MRVERGDYNEFDASDDQDQDPSPNNESLYCDESQEDAYFATAEIDDLAHIFETDIGSYGYDPIPNISSPATSLLASRATNQVGAELGLYPSIRTASSASVPLPRSSSSIARAGLAELRTISQFELKLEARSFHVRAQVSLEGKRRWVIINYVISNQL